MTETRVEAIYARLKEMTVDFRIRPGERLNEVTLARDLNASRTPLREALNRLVAEQLVTLQPGAGFWCRKLDADTIFQLYELREVLEVASVRRACERASETDIAALHDQLHADGLGYVGKTVRQVTAQDEAFHIGIARSSGNAELVRQLTGVNERIRYIRWVDMADRVATTRDEHRAIMAALMARNADAAEHLMRGHIVKRMDQVTAAVRIGFSNIYMPGHEVLFDRPLQETPDD